MQHFTFYSILLIAMKKKNENTIKIKINRQHDRKYRVKESTTRWEHSSELIVLVSDDNNGDDNVDDDDDDVSCSLYFVASLVVSHF